MGSLAITERTKKMNAREAIRVLSVAAATALGVAGQIAWGHTLGVTVQPAAVAPGDSCTVAVSVGTAADPVTDLYGIGLQLQFDPAALVILDQTRGGMPEGPDIVEFGHQEEGMVAYGVARTQPPGTPGHGEVILVRMLARPDAPIGTYALALEDVEAINSAGEEIPLVIVNGELQVRDPEGACCFPAGTCQLLTSDACATAGGLYQGDATTCEPVNPCPQPPPLRACCALSGSCTLTTETACAAPSIWHADWPTCAPNPCPQPPTPGACCFPDGSCQLLTSDDCTTAGGIYQGDATACEPVNPCPQPPPMGACCALSGACSWTIEANCSAPSIWHGDWLACAPNPCPVPTTGACCFRNAYCRILPRARCESLRGIFVGGVCVPSVDPPCFVQGASKPGGSPSEGGAEQESGSWGQVKNRYR